MLGIIFLRRSRGREDFLYVCVCACVCIHARGRNFYPIETKFDTQVGILNSKVQFVDGLRGSQQHQKITFR